MDNVQNFTFADIAKTRRNLQALRPGLRNEWYESYMQALDQREAQLEAQGWKVWRERREAIVKRYGWTG